MATRLAPGLEQVSTRNGACQSRSQKRPRQPGLPTLNLPDLRKVREADPAEDGDKPISKIKIALGAVVLLALVGFYWGLSQAGVLSILTDEQALREWVDQLGFWGPLAIVALMVAAIVFASRLVPFISFDAVSYAAGLTPLTFWRFALATLAGVIPVAFLLAYFGDELLSADSTGVATLLVLLSSITLIPLAAKLLWMRYRRRRRSRPRRQAGGA
jgi:uncharacterized membrane protein YdjX (TVP38/TMEM64 family)